MSLYLQNQGETFGHLHPLVLSPSARPVSFPFLFSAIMLTPVYVLPLLPCSSPGKFHSSFRSQFQLYFQKDTSLTFTHLTSRDPAAPPSSPTRPFPQYVMMAL